MCLGHEHLNLSKPLSTFMWYVHHFSEQGHQSSKMSLATQPEDLKPSACYLFSLMLMMLCDILGTCVWYVLCDTVGKVKVRVSGEGREGEEVEGRGEETWTVFFLLWMETHTNDDI